MRDGPMNTSAGLFPGALASESEPPEAADELLASSGDAESFAELYERYLPAVYRYVGARVRAREEAEDLTSEAFRQVWTSRHSYSGLGAFRAWLFTIARRQTIDWQRARARRRTVPLPDSEDKIGLAAPDTADLALERIATESAMALISALPADQAEIIVLRVVAGLGTVDVARIVGKSPGAVRVAAHRGLRRLADRLDRAGVTR